MGAVVSRLRSAATAVKMLAIGALLVGAGTAGVLYRSDFAIAIAAPPVGTRDFPCGVGTIQPPRKLLRGGRGVDRAGGIDCRLDRRKPPRRSLPMPMPRGIVQHQTNLEMETSQTGNPERRMELEKITPPIMKCLLAVPVGIKNKEVVNQLVSKFPEDKFIVMLFHYDGTLEQWNDLEWSSRAVHVSAQGQTKWWFAKRFLHPDIVAEYEYIFLWDEDIEVASFDPLRYLDVVKREGLEVSQPALDRRSEIHHSITTRPLMPTSDVHRRAQGVRCDNNDNRGAPCMGWVEVMVPVFSQDAWRCVWHMVQNDLIHGWGIDYKLGYCAQGDRTQNVGVVDSEYVLHRVVPILSDGSKASSAARAAMRWRASKEMQIFDKRWQEASAEDKSWIDPYATQSSTSSTT